jgi:hypothetical protein
MKMKKTTTVNLHNFFKYGRNYYLQHRRVKRIRGVLKYASVQKYETIEYNGHARIFYSLKTGKKKVITDQDLCSFFYIIDVTGMKSYNHLDLYYNVFYGIDL